MRKLLAAAMAVSCLACAPPRGVTPCGLELHGAEWLSVESLSEAERVTLEHVGPLVEGDACSMLRGYSVAARGPGRWTASTQEGTVEVDGLANCEARTLEVAEVPGGPWQYTSLAHELAHILTRCTGHVGWTERGITQALTEVYFTGVPDEK